MTTIPRQPKIYHIVHFDKLSSIVTQGHLWSDRLSRQLQVPGTAIGMGSIKAHRLSRALRSHRGLYVGDCVPFYFCPRSVMLYQIYRGNSAELAYKGGQGPIVHLQADLRQVVDWANSDGRRWVFTTLNAAASYAEDYSDLCRLAEIDWEAVEARQWSGPGVDPDVKDGKQAEFLVENWFPWVLVERIGVLSLDVARNVAEALRSDTHQPQVSVIPSWYY